MTSVTAPSLDSHRGDRRDYASGMHVYLDDDIVDAAPDGCEPIHDREYRVRAFRTPDDDLLLRGAIRDQKPAGLYVPDDPQPLTVHHMLVDLRVSFPSLEIVDVSVGFEVHPEELCPTITDHYEQIVGLSIGRGYINKVRELFGGPRGCSHVTALLNAMGPVAVQCFWSMQVARAAGARDTGAPAVSDADREQARSTAWAFNLNSCHVWREDSELVTGLVAGETRQAPIFLRRRLADLGRDPDQWMSTMEPG
jgi:hypothetical protein